MPATASSISDVVTRARSPSKRCTPLRSPPTRNARPSTSRMLPRIEPITAASTTFGNPALNAKMQTNSSGRLPSALCRTPVAPDPNRSPRLSTLRPTNAARAARHNPETTNATTSLTSTYRVTPARTARSPPAKNSRRSPTDRERGAFRRSTSENSFERGDEERVARRQPSRDLEELLSHGVDDRLHARVQLQLLEDVADVVLHAVLADEQLLGD